MPSAVLVESVLESISVAFLKEVNDVATCFVPYKAKRMDINSVTSFVSIVDVVIIIQISLLYQLSSDEEAIVTETLSNRINLELIYRMRQMVILSHVI